MCCSYNMLRYEHDLNLMKQLLCRKLIVFKSDLKTCGYVFI
ncbi:hypothetical protein PARC_a0813 [Pseudoalteromonas arctica A 37-1-2]|uniref:Uncharacterized protein n=1 Tax=Pseudoalteromonas arctica A 37-1-2 TaxID=1117313 RepID=A0A290S0K4_9GAMM|nr:hypothetical protein PARC_a0813 [Pseudoalteromonas arctica A 37-1-2]